MNSRLEVRREEFRVLAAATALQPPIDLGLVYHRAFWVVAPFPNQRYNVDETTDVLRYTPSSTSEKKKDLSTEIVGRVRSWRMEMDVLRARRRGTKPELSRRTGFVRQR